MRTARYIVVLAVLSASLLLHACARQPVVPRAEPPPSAVEVGDTPFIAQSRYQCGPASLAMVLRQSGVAVGVDELVRQVYVPARHGSLQAEMVGASRRHGRIPYVIQPALTAVVAELAQGRPVLVLQNLGLAWWPRWHYAVAVGIDPDRDCVLLHSGTEARLCTSRRRFVRSWSLADGWAMVVLSPGELPADDRPLAYLEALSDYGRTTGDAAALLAGYRAAVRRWPDQPLPWFGLATALEAQGADREAMRSYRQVLALAPDHLPAINNLALLEARHGCRKRALARIDRVLADAPAAALAPVLRETRKEIEALPTGECQR